MVHVADTRLGQQRVSLNINLIVEFLQEITEKQYGGNIEPNTAIWKYTEKIEQLFSNHVNFQHFVVRNEEGEPMYADTIPFCDWFVEHYASIEEFDFLEWEDMCELCNKEPEEWCNYNGCSKNLIDLK
tara:strand:- start:2007 stop:2390 length:384 start_codon:yes stop_codon:yes gene_type:complete